MSELMNKLKLWWYKRSRGKWKRNATFLLDEGRYRCMNYLSMNATDNDFERMVSRCKGAGADTLYLYTSNGKDGSPAPTSFYVAGGIGGAISDRAVKTMQARLMYALEQGMYIVLWLFADDSSAIAKTPIATKLAYARDVVRMFDQFVDEYVVALEADEYLTPADVSRIAEVLRGHGKKVGCHQTSGRCDYSTMPCIDIHYHQYGFGRTANYVANETANIIGRLGKPVVAAEYCLSSTSRNLGDAAMKAGAVGTGNGRSK